MNSFLLSLVPAKTIAKGWCNKSYPLFDRIANILGKDGAAEVPTDMAEVQGNIKLLEMILELTDAIPMSVGKDSSQQSESSHKKIEGKKEWR